MASLFPSSQIPLLLEERQINIAQQQAWEDVEAGWRAREAARLADRRSKMLRAKGLSYLQASPKAAVATTLLDDETRPAASMEAFDDQGLWKTIMTAFYAFACAALTLLMGHKASNDRFPRATSSSKTVLRRDDAARLKHPRVHPSTAGGIHPALFNAVLHSAPKRAIGFLDLPAEIRNQIYTTSIAGMPSNIKLDWFEPIAPSIAHTCRQIRHEYLSLYFENKTIIVNMRDEVRLYHLHRWLGTVKYTPGARKSFRLFKLQYSQSPVEDYFNTHPPSRGPQHLELAMMVQSMAELGLSRDKVEFSIDKKAHVSPQERLTYLRRSVLTLERAYRIVNS
ncbi:hypothetical protein CB0940_04780 [Cercospora beticola]|uniref:F-box domain-containing protein n=1 Tax=Cercospora beticola TaxID=122368 RepID=A0A2G5HMV1_CERBT|nr:hypothetical protein CB0940_04780 [Cercospora beticola]PIA93884.1 hypothetical protein CB0940_04780 [Cercospora beticola]WPB02050.1 hypothetical protein RHO25_006684 [Cercospora beticola]